MLLSYYPGLTSCCQPYISRTLQQLQENGWIPSQSESLQQPQLCAVSQRRTNNQNIGQPSTDCSLRNYASSVTLSQRSWRRGAISKSVIAGGGRQNRPATGDTQDYLSTQRAKVSIRPPPKSAPMQCFISGYPFSRTFTRVACGQKN